MPEKVDSASIYFRQFQIINFVTPYAFRHFLVFSNSSVVLEA